MFTSLSKRSNAPGLRSGGVAGDAALLRQFLLYRTYHGCTMILAVQHASTPPWNDEAHGVNPGRGYVRIALVPDTGECIEAARRIAAFCGQPK